MAFTSRDASPSTPPITPCFPGHPLSEETKRVLYETFSVIRTPFAAWKGIDLARRYGTEPEAEARSPRA